MAKHGIENLCADVISPALHEPNIVDTVDQALAGAHTPTAVIGCDDAMAAAP